MGKNTNGMASRKCASNHQTKNKEWTKREGDNKGDAAIHCILSSLMDLSKNLFIQKP